MARRHSRLGRAIGRRLIAASFALSGPAAAELNAIHTISAGESLAGIAAQAYGDGLAWTAIMLATNSRLAEVPELEFIGDPNQLRPGQRVWLPDPTEKNIWMRRFRAYVTAVLDMSLPQPWEVSNRLVAISPAEPVRVVTWARSGQFSLGATRSERQIWVTVVPHLREFCRALANREDLVSRLEQRLGLPPASNKTEFVEIILSDPATDLFRPCADPRIDTTSCPLGPPGGDQPTAHRDWFLSQYFASYAQAHPTRFPWTSLGYTYDWGNPQSEEGEAEFVIRAGADYEVVTITSTVEYCRP